MFKLNYTFTAFSGLFLCVRDDHTHEYIMSMPNSADMDIVENNSGADTPTRSVVERAPKDKSAGSMPPKKGKEGEKPLKRALPVKTLLRLKRLLLVPVVRIAVAVPLTHSSLVQELLRSLMPLKGF